MTRPLFSCLGLSLWLEAYYRNLGPALSRSDFAANPLIMLRWRDCLEAWRLAELWDLG